MTHRMKAKFSQQKTLILFIGKKDFQPFARLTD